MDVKVNNIAFKLVAVGWGSTAAAEGAVAFARDRLRDNPSTDLDAIAKEAAHALNVLRGSLVLQPIKPTVGVIEMRLVSAFERPSQGTRKVTAKDLARRLDLRLDAHTVRLVGGALRRHVGPPRHYGGALVWDVPNVWK